MAARGIATLLAFLITLCPYASPAQEITYTPIPPGFDFPADEQVLLDALRREDIPKLRDHSWQVFAGLTQKTRPNEPDSEAIWETWYHGDEVFSAGAAPQNVRVLRRDLITPRQFAQPGAAMPQAVGESVLAGTLFNQEMKDHTRSNKLQMKATLKVINDGWTATTPIKDRKVPDYPRMAMSLKLVWMLVSKDGMTPLPIWDELPRMDVYPALPEEKWARKIAVDPSREVIPPGETVDIPGFPNSRVVPINAFYHFKFDASFAATVGAEEGDFAVLVAMHYTTKEIPNWVWATFWWHDQPNLGPYAEGRLDASKIGGAWRNYLMDVAYDMNQPQEIDATPDAVFNPWVEARFSNGVNSNCMTCHQLAVWSKTAPNFLPFLPITRGTATDDDPRFKETTKVDFLWSLLFEGNQE